MTKRGLSQGRRWRVWLALLLLVVGLGLTATGAASPHREATDQLAAGSESAKVAELRQRLPQGSGSMAIVVFASENRLSPAQFGALAQKAVEVSGQAKPPVVPSRDGTAIMVPVPVAGESASQLSGPVGKIRERARAGLPDGVTAQVTGPAAVQTDLAAVFSGANVKLLGATALVVAFLLILTYRSPLLWMVPLLVVGIADRLATVVATRGLNLMGLSWDESTTGILSVLVFGAGTDYALLLIARYRDELHRHDDRFQAIGVATRATTEPVLASASTVFVGLLTLVLSLFPATRGLGVACAVGVVIAAVFVLGVLPGVLVLFPRSIFWPRTPKLGEPPLVESTSVWSRVGRVVAHSPRTVLAATLAVLALASVGLGFLRVGLPQNEAFTTKPEAIAGAERLARSYPAGASDPIRVLTTPAQATAVTARLTGLAQVAMVQPGARSDEFVELQVIGKAQPGSDAALDAVRAVRAALADQDGTRVGGTEAARLDVREGQSHDRRVIFPVVLLLVLGALALLLRSLLAPILLVGTVLLTYGAALGASWWVFQGMGYSALDGSVPLYAFVFLVALGVDYNIFLVTRAKEEAAEHGARIGMLRALAVTGGVITSAGVLLASVFAALGVLPLVVLAQLGVVIFIGVLLDTLVVRTLLVPALGVMLDRHFWWPRKLG